MKMPGNDAPRMSKRPYSVTAISWLFIATGVVGFASHLSEFMAQRPVQYSILLLCFIAFLAILSGGFMLRGRNWARWLLLVWIALHVILSAFHRLSELLVHSLLFVVVAYFLMRRRSSSYFLGAKLTESPKIDGRP
jgi:hypothetical protein